MIHQDDFYQKLKSFYLSSKAFVAYRKPNENELKLICQKNVDLYFVDNFNESGFVFAPFDSEDNAILFPVEICDMYFTELSYNQDVSIKTKTTQPNSSLDHEHIALVEKGIDSIVNGPLQKVVLSRVETLPFFKEDPVLVFESLLKAYANAFVYIWHHPKKGLWLGATPETLLKIEGSRFETMSLAGTQLYRDTKDIEWDDKNLEEQQWVTNYIEEELSSIVKSLKTAPLQTIRAGNLMHLQSKISGVIPPNALKQVIACLHPTPAVCGIPKNLAKAFILKNETYHREYYTGYLGELNLKVAKLRNTNSRNIENNAYSSLRKRSELFVNLRCMQLKNNMALIYVGGGITKDSNPKDEYMETVNKAQTILSALQRN